MELVAISTLFIIGLSYGSSVCLFTCLPFLAPLLVANSNETKKSLKILIPFSIGRIFAYITISLLATLSALFIKDIINDSVLSKNILASATFLMGCVILYNAYKQSQKCCTKSNKTDKISTFGYFIMGFGISFNLCAPVLTLISISANSQSFLYSVIYGLSFGFGVVSIGFILFVFVFAKLLRGFMMEFSKYKKHIEIFAGYLLIALSIFVYNGWIKL